MALAIHSTVAVTTRLIIARMKIMLKIGMANRVPHVAGYSVDAVAIIISHDPFYCFVVLTE